MIDNPPRARTSGARPISWFLCSIPLLAAGTLVAVRYGRSHDAAYTAGAVISTWFVGALIAAGLRFAYICSPGRQLHIIAPATLLIAGVTSLLADIGQVAT